MVSFRKTFVLLFGITFVLGLGFAIARGPKVDPPGFLFIANQYEHTALLVDLRTKGVVSRVEVGVNGHEVAVDPAGHLGYVPIYSSAVVGKPGSDGDHMDVIDLGTHKLSGRIDLGKPVRPHSAKFGPDGLLYVTAELDQAVYAVDVRAGKVVAKIPTGALQSHMILISPDGKRAYTANNGAGSVSVLDLEKRALVTVIPVAKSVQRLSITPDGKRLFTHDQDQPRIAIIDTTSNTLSGWIKVDSVVFTSVVVNDGRQMIASSFAGKMFSVDLDKSAQTGAQDVCPAMGELALTHDGNRAYLSCPQTGELLGFNAHNGKPDMTIMLTKGIDGLQWFPAVK